jgi:hypothetical protein
MNWGIQSITSVGYGDTSIVNNFERIIGSIIMIAGLILFTVANSMLITIANSLGESSEYNDKVDGVIQTCKETSVGRLFQLRVHRSLLYNEHHNNDSTTRLIKSLPL